MLTFSIGLLKCSKNFQIFFKLEIMLVNCNQTDLNRDPFELNIDLICFYYRECNFLNLLDA